MKGRELMIGLRITLTVLLTDTFQQHIINKQKKLGAFCPATPHNLPHQEGDLCLLDLTAHALKRKGEGAVAAVHQVQVHHYLQCNLDHEYGFDDDGTSSSWVFFSYTLIPPSLGGTLPSQR